MHPLLRYALVGTPLALLVFLGLSDFATRWDGHVVSQRPAGAEDPAVLTVLVVDAEGEGTEVDWPAAVVRPLDLAIDPTGTPPNKIPETAATTSKDRFTFQFTVTPAEGEARVVPTTSARAVSLAVLAWVMGLALFNLMRSGSPWSWEARRLELPPPQPGSTQVPAAPTGPRIPQHGPPPPKRRRGGGRRR